MININSNVHYQLSDFTTPVNVLLAIREKYPLTLLLESSDYQSKENSFSFLGFDPIATATVVDGTFSTSLGHEVKLDLTENRLSDFPEPGRLQKYKKNDIFDRFRILSGDTD